MGYKENLNNQRERFVKVFNDTLSFINEDEYLKDAVNRSVINTLLYPAVNYPKQESRTIYLNNVFVTKHKTLEATIELRKLYPNARIGVLNFASATNPGGGVKKGSSAQEESICRCSTLYPCLTKQKIWDTFYNVNRSLGNPLHTDDIVYVPDVIICKSDDGEYRRLKRSEFVKIDVITCAAPNLKEKPSNSFNEEGTQESVSISEEELYNLHLNRAKHILDVAHKNGVEVLVLGAFGCGAFKNNPAVVAKAYKDALKDFASLFTEIEFAIFCKSYETENYDIFKNILA